MKRHAWVLGGMLALQPMLAQATILVLIEGVPGPGMTAPYQGWHLAESASWNLDRANAAQPFKFTLSMRQKSAAMATIKQAAFSGALFKKLTIDVAAEFSGQGLKPIARLVCENATIGRFAFSGSGNDAPVTQLDLSCSRLLWEDFEYNFSTGAFIKSLKGEITFLSKTS